MLVGRVRILGFLNCPSIDVNLAQSWIRSNLPWTAQSAINDKLNKDSKWKRANALCSGILLDSNRGSTLLWTTCSETPHCHEYISTYGSPIRCHLDLRISARSKDVYKLNLKRKLPGLVRASFLIWIWVWCFYGPHAMKLGTVMSPSALTVPQSDVIWTSKLPQKV